jgi:hypothetical protein
MGHCKPTTCLCGKSISSAGFVVAAHMRSHVLKGEAIETEHGKFAWSIVPKTYVDPKLSWVTPGENWRPVLGFDGFYEVSDLGRVRSLRTSRGIRVIPKVLKQQERKGGYLHVVLKSKTDKRLRLVHQLVLESFIGTKPSGKQCAHGDGKRQNNVLGNLRWATPKENSADRMKHGTTSTHIVKIYKRYLERRAKEIEGGE